jgi:ethanolamine utilization protein EutQ (cupin superfamily)
MARFGLVTLVHQHEMNWESLPTDTGTFRICRPFTARESPTIGGGLVELAESELPWKPNYDEIVIVMEGELTIRQGNEDLAGRAGDMFLIRYGADITYRTETKAKFAWVLYPTSWKNLRWPE